MIVTSPEVRKTVTDFDFLSSNSLMSCWTIDKEAGDTITFLADRVQIYIAPKPTIGDPDVVVPAESVTLFVRNLLSIASRDREIVELSPAQKAERTLAFQEAAGKVRPE